MSRLTWNDAELRTGDQTFLLAHRIATAITMGDVIVVLYDPDATPGKVDIFENIVGLGRQGAVLWTAAVPTSGTGDCYTGLHEDLGQLVATSWSGWRVRIDPATGAIVDREFVK